MASTHSVIILPGLGDRVGNLRFATRWWNAQGLTPYVLRMGWSDRGRNLQNMLNEVIELAEKLSAEGLVSVVGTSAGGSAAFNVFYERPDLFVHAVNVCGRLREGEHNFRSLDIMAATSPVFKQSVLLFESRESELTPALRARMMTVRARFGDECVPGDTSRLDGAHSMLVPVFGHGLGSSLALTVFGKQVIRFIQQGSDS